MNLAYLPAGIDDARLERRIRDAKQMMLDADRADVRQVYARCMADLIALRSPQQVAAMERLQGLR